MTKLTEIDGLPVFNAKRPVKITITEKDCKGGNPKHPDTCAAARCMMREFHASEVRVHLSRAYVKTTPDKWVRYMTSKPLRTEIVAFDRGGTFAPGTYHLMGVAPSSATGRHQGGVNKRKKNKTPGSVVRATRHVVTDVRTGPA